MLYLTFVSKDKKEKYSIIQMNGLIFNVSRIPLNNLPLVFMLLYYRLVLVIYQRFLEILSHPPRP